MVEFLESIDAIRDVQDQIPPDSLSYLSLSCKLVELKELDIVCRYGEASSSVFYILEGQVAVTSNTASKYTKELINSSTLSMVPPRTFFGEAGVMSKSQRTANCVCTGPTKLLVIEGRAYLETVGKIVMAFKQKKIAFLQKVSILEGWDYPKIVAFYDSISNKRLQAHYGTILFGQKQHLDTIFVVISGQVEISV